MNWGIRATCALGVALCTLAPATAAGAASEVQSSPPLLQSNWYFHRLVSDSPVVGLPDVEPSNVPAGDLPVASRDGKGTPSKLSIVAFELPTDATGASFRTFDVTMTVDPNANNVIPSDLKLEAAPALRNWSNGSGGTQDVVNAPPTDTTAVVPGKISTDGKTVLFHAVPIAQHWADDANFGLELLPAKGYTTPFQVNFLGGKAVKSRAAYTPAAPTAPAVAAPAAASGTTGAAPAPAAGLPALAPSTDTLSTAPSLTAPALAAPVPAAAPQVAAAPAARSGATARLATVSARPTAALVLVGLAALGLLALISIILGGEPVSVVGGPPSRLSAVLQSRAGRAAGPSHRPVAIA